VLFETMMLVASAAVVAVLAAPTMLSWTVGLLPPSMMLLKPPVVDLRAALAVASISAIFIAAVTILVSRLALKGDVLVPLVAASRTATSSSWRGRLVIGFQTAAGTVLVVMAGLFGASLQRAWDNAAGFERERTAVVEAYPIVFTDAARATAEIRDLQRAVESLPGVAAVAGADITLVPDTDVEPSTDYAPQNWDRSLAGIPSFEVERRFFGVIGLALRSGRWPSATEWESIAPIALVSETAARRFRPGQSIVGQVLHAPPATGDRPPPPVTVVGVVSDARFLALDRAPTGEVYVPDGLLNPTPFFTFFIRTTGPAASVLRAVAARVRDDPRFRLARARTVEDAVVASIRPRLLRAWLFGGFGLAAVVILGTGVFAVVASLTARRFREIGIRVAIGATPARIVRLFAVEQTTAIGSGLILGGALAAWIAPLTRPLLYEVESHDWRAWLIAVGVIVLTAVTGVLMPSLHAALRNPVDALRPD
jgi:hypothetical protein